MNGDTKDGARVSVRSLGTKRRYEDWQPPLVFGANIELDVVMVLKSPETAEEIANRIADKFREKLFRLVLADVEKLRAERG